jgi:hypothetical protein
VKFGKHSGLTFWQLAHSQRGYCSWLLEQPPKAKSRDVEDFLAYLRQLPEYANASQGVTAKATAKAESDRRLELLSAKDAPAGPASAKPTQALPDWVRLQLGRGDAVLAGGDGSSLGNGHFFATFRGDKERLLHPYQRRGIAAGVSRGGRILLGDEMGLGKTVQALGS